MEELLEDSSKKKSYRHPKTVFFHMFFRTTALTTYFLGSLISSNFILNFIIIVMLLSFDFWTVKNITGRFLVGLRWWNKVDEDGKSEWLFESKKNFKPLASESNLFWWSLYLFPVAWVFFFFTALISLNVGNMLMVIVAISLQLSNVFGYHKCALVARQRNKDAGDDGSTFQEDPVSLLAGRMGRNLVTRAAENLVAASVNNDSESTTLSV
eukprot:m.229045 g.229045  ORF g.229045 m.229045 type:complete len:211 (-) comp15985_c0_seq13:3948-4580(-)